MSSLLLRSGQLLCLLCCALYGSAQADLSVSIEVPVSAARADQSITATIYLVNEGTAERRGSAVQLRMSPGLFFVDQPDKTRKFDDTRLEWTVATLAPGKRDSLRVVVQPNVGGVHTLTAELTTADGDDWDSRPGNAASAEDDQDEVCISVPISLECGQTAVLRAPKGRKAYTWYRNDTALLYAKSDTLHPQASGAYRFVLNGESCASGNCCPVLVERQPCAADMALVVASKASPRGKNHHAIRLTLFNEGSGPVSRADYYLTTSRYLRLSDQATASNWQISTDRMRRSYREVILPGDSAIVTFDLETIPGGAVKDYRVFAEIAAFYSGTKALADADSTPDEDPTNDAVVDGGRRLPRDIDEDDSDIAVLSNCAITAVAGVRKACANEAFTLTASTATTAKVTYAWSGEAVFSCRDCAAPSIKLTKATDLTLVTKSADNCEQRETIRIEVEDCTQRLLMVVSPYGKTQECLNLAAGAAVKWCGGQVPSALTMRDAKGQSGTTCLTGTSTGLWAGIATPCLEICQSGACRPVSLQVLALPKKDTVLAPATGGVCLTNVLQVQSTIVSTRLLDNTGTITLAETGSNCYDVRRPTEAFPAKTITVIHEYRLLDRSVFDTTLVRIPASNACSFDVLAQAGYELPLPATGNASLCIAGARNVVTALKYTLDGQALAAPSEGCESFTVAKFSLRGLPANYTDNGWRVERYEVDGKLIISNKQASSLANVADLLQATDPKSKVSTNAVQKSFEVEDFTKEPTRLRLRHLSTNVLLDLRPVVVNGSRGWALVLPAGLSPKRYTLIATNAAGCSDTAGVTIVKANAKPAKRDTFPIEIELGEPLYLADLKGYTVPAGSAWASLGTGYTTTFSRAETNRYTFTRTEGEDRFERLYVITAVAYACSPAISNPAVTLKSDACDAQTVALGLTKPNLATNATSGSAQDLAKVTGSRAGASYSIAQLPDRGLTEQYTILAWSGVKGAGATSGNLQAIVAKLRRAGVDIYVDWQSNTLFAAGENLGELRLQTSDQRTLTMQVTKPSLDTYGSLYLRPGNSLVSVGDGACKASINAEFKCKPRVIVNGGGVFVGVGGFFLMPFDGLGIPAGYAINTDTWKPEMLTQRVAATDTWKPEELSQGAAPKTWKKEEVRVRVSDDSTGLVFSSEQPITTPVEVVLQACNAAGDCVDVVFTVKNSEASCGLDLWTATTTEATIAVGQKEVEFLIPSTYDPATDEVHLDGKVIRTVTQVKRPTYRTYPAFADYDALRTPSGKTVNVANRSVADAAAHVFAEARIKTSATEVSVEGAEAIETLFGQRPDGTWTAVEPLVERMQTVPALALTAGKHVISITREGANQTACTDSIIVEATHARVARRRETLELSVGEKQQYCLPAPRKDGVVVRLSNDCKGASGELIAVEWAGACLTLEAYEPGEERICVTRYYLDGGVDSITLQMRSTAARELHVLADRDTLEFGQFKVIEVLRNDELADEPLSLSLVSEPFFGRAQVVGNSAIEYLHYGGDCAKDIFTYEVCQGDNCETTTVELIIYCDELLIYNGLSPNGDGVNEEFTILGLGQYPNHQISIFNREGNLLTELRDYGNDWRGEINGNQLAEGTYFYVIDLGTGETRSGYLQLTR